MDLNLIDPIDRDLETQLIPALSKLGWKQVDTHTFEVVIQAIDFEEEKFFLVVYPELLHYHSKEGDQIQVWYKCRVNGKEEWTDESIGAVADYLKEFFPKLPWKPFHDEDALRGYFSKGKNRYGDPEIAFYINPSFPKGAWCNHTL